MAKNPTKTHHKATLFFLKENFWERFLSYWLILPFIALPFYDRGPSILLSCSFVIALILLIINGKQLLLGLSKNNYILIFLAFFVPACISLIDSLNIDLTYKLLWRYVRYFGYAVIALYAFKSIQNRDTVLSILFWLIILYSIDAICHWIFEFNIYGYNPLSNGNPDRVRGVFRNTYHLSYFIATLSPLVFFYLLQKIKSGSRFFLYLSPFFIILVCLTVLLGGARAGMVSLFISILFSIIYLFYQNHVPNKKSFLIIFGILIVILLIVLPEIDVISSRFSNTYIENQNFSDFLARFTSLRTNIWQVVIHNIPEYWINGAGIGGTDVIYQTYPESYKVFDKVYHPHLHVFEVLIETGIIGLVPYLLVCLYLLYRFFIDKIGNPWFLVAFLAIMPINSHASLFERDWMPVIWVSIAIAMSYTNPKRN